MFVSILDKDLPAEVATKEHLGGKGYGLWFMQQQGINVPPALIIPTTYCVEYMKGAKQAKAVMAEVEKKLQYAYDFFHQQFGYMPLLSVRSGARISMPGMMDTILNVGLDDSNRQFWEAKIGEACALDCRARLICMYGSVVKGLDLAKLEKDRAVYYQEATGQAFPAGKEQILSSIEAVFKSWDNERAKIYRKLHDIPGDWGTAVILQAMVFGNSGPNSLSGVMFSRNYITGDPAPVIELGLNCQGEDVVAGRVTPMDQGELAGKFPALYAQLLQTCQKLEDLTGDLQDIEVTVQDGVLYMLQTRNGKRTAKAAIRVAVDLYYEGKLDRATALKRVSAKEYDLAQQPVIDPAYKDAPFATGIAACSGVVTGVVVHSAAAALECKEPCILVTSETNPDDIGGMVKAVGVLTMTGGATSHAAVVARSLNKPCVVGVGKPQAEFPVGVQISIDGATGRVWFGKVPVVGGVEDEYLARLRDLIFKGDATAVLCDPAQPITGVNYAVLRFGDLLKVPDLAGTLVARAKEVKTLYLDLSGFNDPVQQAYDDLLGISASTNTLDMLKALNNGLPDNVVTLGLTIGNSPSITVVDNMTQLVMNEGTVLYHGEKGQTIERVLSLKRKAGESVLEFGKINPVGPSFLAKEKLIIELLG